MDFNVILYYRYHDMTFVKFLWNIFFMVALINMILKAMLRGVKLFTNFTLEILIIIIHNIF